MHLYVYVLKVLGDIPPTHLTLDVHPALALAALTRGWVGWARGASASILYDHQLTQCGANTGASSLYE